MAALITTAFGAGALEVLAEHVGRAKSGDPLAPVVVVVPTDRIGVTARRGLARAGVGGRPGVAGITVVTLRRLAESVATSTLTADSRMPVTRSVLVAAMNRLLAEGPGQEAGAIPNQEGAIVGHDGDPFWEVAYLASANSRFTPVSPNWANVEDSQVLQDMLVKIFSGAATIEEATTEASEAITATLNG